MKLDLLKGNQKCITYPTDWRFLGRWTIKYSGSKLGVHDHLGISLSAEVTYKAANCCLFSGFFLWCGELTSVNFRYPHNLSVTLTKGLPIRLFLLVRWKVFGSLNKCIPFITSWLQIACKRKNYSHWTSSCSAFWTQLWWCHSLTLA